MEKFDISELQEFLIGQASDENAMTGCTAIIAPEGAVTGVDVRGGSPGSRDIAALNPLCNREVVHAVLLSGGSAFGLDAASGLVELLEEKKIGRSVGVTVVPNVCEAVLFDLMCGSSDVRPNAAMGRLAGENAFKILPFQSGNYGAGTGATIGKSLGVNNSMKGGVGIGAFKQGDLMVAAVFAVNCVGDIHEHGQIIAGARKDGKFIDSEEVILNHYEAEKDLFNGNTVIGCIMTNAKLNKSQATRLAAQGHNGIARVVYPAHSIYDGDTVFAMCSGKVDATQDAVGILAAHATKEAILNAVKSAKSYGQYPAFEDVK